MAPGLLLHGLPTPDEEKHFDLSRPAIKETEIRSYLNDSLAEQNPYIVTPKVSRLDLSSYDSQDDLIYDIVESMKHSGGCIIRNMIPKDTLNSMESEIRPHLDQVQQADSSRNDFVPSSTRLVTGLLSKSRTYALNIVGNDIWQSVSEYFLTCTLNNSWHGSQSRTSVSKPQLSTTVTFSVRPGTPAQGLHRDDDIYHTWHPAASSHHQGRDTMVCFFVAGTRCTAANGATCIVPGSHLWDFSVPPPTSSTGADSHFRAEMEPGDAFMMLGGTYHGAGANTTVDQERLVYAAFATRGYLRQEENQYLANDLAKIRELPEKVQRFAGFGVSKPFMGWVDMEDPITKVLGREKDDGEGYW